MFRFKTIVLAVAIFCIVIVSCEDQYIGEDVDAYDEEQEDDYEETEEEDLEECSKYNGYQKLSKVSAVFSALSVSLRPREHHRSRNLW